MFVSFFMSSAGTRCCAGLARPDTGLYAELEGVCLLGYLDAEKEVTGVQDDQEDIQPLIRLF